MNKVIITNDFEKVIKDTLYDEIVLRDELKIEDVRVIKKSAYIAEKEKKVILIVAEKYNVYAQNALLKLLEESPKNIEFILLAKSKYALLDTILSRLILERRFFEKEIKEIEVKNISNSFIFELLKKDLEKEDVKSILKSLLKLAKNEDELKIINDAILMIELNIDLKAVLSMVMLEFKERK
ncbi:DNA polymerase III subunit delta' [Caminibacter profundus]